MLFTRNKRLRQISAILETGNLLSLKLFLKNPRAARRFPHIIHSNYMALVGQGAWTSKSIFEILPDLEDTQVTIAPMPGRGIVAPVDELVHLALITKALAPRTVFEIGTFRGRTALGFALNSPADCTVYTLDLPQEERGAAARSMSDADERVMSKSVTGADYKGKPGAEKIVQLFGNSMTFDFSPYRGKVDLMYIDGAHHYDAVLSDTRNALEMVRPGGAIVFDDFGHYGDFHDVTRAVTDVIGLDRVVQIENTDRAVYFVPERFS